MSKLTLGFVGLGRMGGPMGGRLMERGFDMVVFDMNAAALAAAVAKGAGIDVVKIPPQSPDLNPICERFLGGVR
ncbi:MAG: hypothetical protein JKX69_01505, partial [Rhodobacteraceae bacterium]|nr:hypothetical protein [Paracoccaceae bacterium]